MSLRSPACTDSGCVAQGTSRVNTLNTCKSGSHRWFSFAGVDSLQATRAWRTSCTPCLAVDVQIAHYCALVAWECQEKLFSDPICITIRAV